MTRNFRQFDCELLALRNLKPEVKLILGEVIAWDNYYRTQKNCQLRYNPVRLSLSTGINLIKTVLYVTKLVEFGVLAVGDEEGYSTIYPAHDIKTIVEMLSNGKNK
jgi:hypothetical protein